MKKMKKVLAMLLASSMIMSISMTALAEEEGSGDNTKPATSLVTNGNPTFTKTYNETYDGSISPEETFTFTFTNGQATSYSDASITAPEITSVNKTFGAGHAGDTQYKEQAIAIALSNIEWPGVGVYTYDVKETPGNTAGVKYDDATAKLKVTVAYNDEADPASKYYVAFVTLTTEDRDNDEKTDSKIAGFTNEYTAGNLSIYKKVTGNMGDQNKVFDVTVTFTRPEGKVVNSTIGCNSGCYLGDGAVTKDSIKLTKIEPDNWNDDGTVTVTVQVEHDATINFTNIPDGVTYTVVEDTYSDYTTSYQYYDKTGENETAGITVDGVDYTATSGTLSVDTEYERVEITNNRTTTVDTGIILDSAPYALLLALVAMGVFAVVNKKREEEF